MRQSLLSVNLHSLHDRFARCISWLEALALDHIRNGLCGSAARSSAWALHELTAV